MKVTLSNYKIKVDGNVIGFYNKDTIGIPHWYGEYEINGIKYVKHATTLSELRWIVSFEITG